MSGATKGFFIENKQTHINKLIRKLGLSPVYRRQIEHEYRVFYSKEGPVIQRDYMFNEINDFINGVINYKDKR